MRIIGVFAMCLLFAACATAPIFPPEIMKDIETDPTVITDWKDQANHPSDVKFVPHKVELGGQIMGVIPKPEGWSLLVAEEPLEKYQWHDFTRVQQKNSFWYAIAINGVSEPSMLQRGNKLVVVGATDGTSTEIIDGARKVLPQLLAQCLHVWQIDASEANRFPYGDTAGYFPPEKTFCDESKGSSSSTGSHNHETTIPTGR